MADIANQLEGAVEGLDRFLEALDNSSMKLGSNAAIESKLARAAAKKADQELRFRKKVDKMEKEIAKRETQHLAQLKAAEPLRKKVFASLKQELKAKSDLIKQTKGLGGALKKVGAGFEGVIKGLSGFAKGLKAGIKSAIGGGAGGIMAGLEKIPYLGGILATMVAGGKTLVDLLMSHQKLMADITRQTGLTGKAAAAHRLEVRSLNDDIKKYGYKLKQTLKLTQDLREAFGDVSYVTNDLVKMSAELQIAWRMGTQEANELIEATERAGFGAREFEKTIKRTAMIMGADLGVVMRDVAKNVGMIEMYAGRGEEYFARMATRAAMLGTSMETLEKSGEVFADFEGASEKIGKMSQLFGAGFTDGLKSLTEMRLMYERGDMLGIQEHMSEQVAKTLYYQDGVLKSMKTGEKLWMSQIKAHAEVMNIDEVTARRMLESSAMLNVMKLEGFKLTQEQKEVYGSELDYVMAMRSVQKEMTNEEGKRLKDRDILQKLDESGWKALVKESEVALEARAAAAKDSQSIEEQTIASMDKLTVAMNEITSEIEQTAEASGKKLEEVIGPAVTRLAAGGTAAAKAFGDGIQKFIDTPVKDLEGLTEIFRKTAQAGLQAGLPEVFGEAGKVELSFTDMVTRGLIAAMGGDQKQGLWAVMKTRMMEAWDYGVDRFWELAYFLEDMFHRVTTEIGIVIYDALPGADYTKEQKAQRRERDVLGAGERAFGRSDEMLAWEGAVSSGGSGGIMNIGPKPQFEGADRLAELEKLINADIDPIRAGGGLGPGDERYDKRNARALALSRVHGPDLGKYHQLMAQGDRGGADAILEKYNHAKGYAGGRHRGIVGEAGTEVGITRGALRELASAGIPGYQNGSNFVNWATDTEGLTRGAGGGLETRSRQAAAQRSGDPYRENLNRFEQDFLNIPRRIPDAIGDVWARDSKEFFVKYPAIVDEAIGAPFRQAGPVAKGLYEAAFSGMQAYSRAELSGATPEGARKLMYQNMVAQGLKPGGTIDQGLISIRKLQAKQVAESGKILDVNRLSNAALGGLAQGLSDFSKTYAATGDYDRAKEMGKRGAIGGLVRDLTATFGAADPEFLGTMQVMGMLMGQMPLPPYAGKDAGDMLTTALGRTERTFQGQGRGVGWGGQNAQGRVYNSPHLAMVGEGSQNEIIVPTERIRKGLPINAGVARELGSIGVPGYQVGKHMYSHITEPAATKSTVAAPSGLVGFGMKYGSGEEYAGSRGGASLYNLKAGAGMGVATAGAQFANTYMQTGDSGYAAGQSLGSGLGFATSLALGPFLGPFAPLVGSLVGAYVGNKLGKKWAYKPKYKKFRERALLNIEEHVLTKGRFMPGQPSGIKTQINKALSGGKQQHPTQKAMNQMVEAVADSTVLGYGLGEPGMGADTLLALLAGEAGGEAPALYQRYNKIFYPNEMAKGGIVTGPTRAVIGEKGPEAVIPLDQHGGYATRQQMDDQKNIIGELRKQNQQMGMFIKRIGDAKTVLQVDGRTLAETVGSNMYDIGSGM